MNHLLWTFTLICSYGLIFWTGAPQGTMNYGTTRWSFFHFLHYLRFLFPFRSPKDLPADSKVLPDTFVILSALPTASEAFSATTEALSAASEALPAAAEALPAASGALSAAFEALQGA